MSLILLPIGKRNIISELLCACNIGGSLEAKENKFLCIYIKEKLIYLI